MYTWYLVRVWLLLVCLESAFRSYGFSVLSASSHPFYHGWHRWRQWRHDDLSSNFKRAESTHFLTGGAHGPPRTARWFCLYSSSLNDPSPIPSRLLHHIVWSPIPAVISLVAIIYLWLVLLLESTTGIVHCLLNKQEKKMTCFYGELWCRILKYHHVSGRLMAKCSQRSFIILKIKLLLCLFRKSNEDKCQIGKP